MTASIARRPVLTHIAAVALLGLMATPAFALDLDQARSQGLIGERPDGLVGAVAASPNAEVTALVQSVNAARLENYKGVAQKNGTPLDAVQKIAGEKLIEKAKENKWYAMTANGQWQK